MSARKKHRTIHEYLRYLKGELSQEERHTLERNLEADPFEKEAMEGFEMISAGELEEDILSLHSRLHKRQQRRRRVALYSIAATVASLLVVGTIFINIYDFNPETDREAVQAEESQLMDKSPEPGEAAASENPDLEEAFFRIKNYVAPVNAMRLDKKTPCVKTSFCEECKSPDRICNTWTVTEKSYPKGRVKVVLINEEQGF